MRKITLIALALVSGVAMAQHSGGVKQQSTTNPDAVQIQGNTEINANAQNLNAVAVGKDNTAKNAVGAIKGGTQIQGNTKINANAKNVNAVAVGQGNTATNDVGTIGGK